MKKYLLSLLAVAVAASACEKTNDDAKDPADDSGITMEYTYKQARSVKRGLSFNNLIKTDLELLAPGVYWLYNWGSSTSVTSLLGEYNMTYYPMVWGGNPDEQKLTTCRENIQGCDLILAYNEPNLTDQANMTPARAAELWPSLVAVADKLGMRLTSPAMNYGTLAGYSDPEVWLDEFYAQPGVSLDDVDVTAAHCYMPSGESLKSFVRKFYKYGKPVFMTEFCHAQGNITNNVQSQMRFMCDALNYLEGDNMVGGYSWFKERGGTTWSAISLLGINASNPQLTDLGKVYVNFSSFDKSVYYAIGEAIPAEHYTNNSLTATANTDQWETAPRVKPTTDVTGILELCDFYAVGNWVEYQIDVAQSGDYEMLLRYASNFDSQFTLSIDGEETPISLEKTGSETTWRTASTPVHIEGGKHTIRLTLAKGRANFNWFCFR